MIFLNNKFYESKLMDACFIGNLKLVKYLISLNTLNLKWKDVFNKSVVFLIKFQFIQNSSNFIK